MSLILGDERLNVGEFPDLLAERFGIHAAEFLATTPALGRHARHDNRALLGRNQFTQVLVVTGLAAALALRLGLSRRRLRVRVHGGRRLGGVGRVLAGQGFELGFEFRNAHAEQLDLPRLPRDQREDFRR